MRTGLTTAVHPDLPAVYLLHFDPAFHHASHYVGYVERASGLLRRLDRHRAGRGGRLPRAAHLAGSHLSIVRVWTPGSLVLERKLKKSKAGPRLCPICKRK